MTAARISPTTTATSKPCGRLLETALIRKDSFIKGIPYNLISPAAGTGLSSHELNQPGCYRDVKDTTMVAQFKMKHPKPEMAEWGTPYFLAWTTTPWTFAQQHCALRRLQDRLRGRTDLQRI